MSELEELIQKHIDLLDEKIVISCGKIRAFINLDVEGTTQQFVVEEASALAFLCSLRGQVINRGVELGLEKTDYENAQVLNGLPEEIQKWVVTKARQFLFARYDSEQVYDPLEKDLITAGLDVAESARGTVEFSTDDDEGKLKVTKFVPVEENSEEQW